MIDLDDIVFTVETEDSELDNYETLLEAFQSWKSFKREIKLTNLLEGKRVQYTVDDIRNNNIFGTLYIQEKDVISLKDVAFHVKSMIYIINGDKVENLKIQIKILETPEGKILKSLLESNIPISMKQRKVNDKVLYFYTDYYKPNAA